MNSEETNKSNFNAYVLPSKQSVQVELVQTRCVEFIRGVSSSLMRQRQCQYQYEYIYTWK